MPCNNEVINTEQTVQAQDALITCTVQGFVRFKWVKKQTKPSCGSRYRTYVRIQIHTSGSRYKRPDPDTYVRIQIQTSGSRYKRPDPDTNVRIQIQTSGPKLICQIPIRPLLYNKGLILYRKCSSES